VLGADGPTPGAQPTGRDRCQVTRWRTPTLTRVPLLSHHDPLPFRPSRITVNGTSGAGKSTLARRIADLLDLPYTEVDSLYHGPGWTPCPNFVEAVDELTSGARWVCEYQYDAARPILSERADLLVWVDVPTAVAMWRVTRRTVSRRVRRQELWNGNREGPLRELLSDPDHIVRYAWRTRRDATERARGILARQPRLPVVHLHTTREVRQWVAGPLTDTLG
jgi:adenylate kinase family enzyme